MLDDAMDIRVLRLEQLMQPMNGFNVRIATHFAENGGTFDSLVGNRIEFAKQCGSSDFSHNNVLCGLDVRRTDFVSQSNFLPKHNLLTIESSGLAKTSEDIAAEVGLRFSSWDQMEPPYVDC